MKLNVSKIIFGRKQPQRDKILAAKESLDKKIAHATKAHQWLDCIVSTWNQATVMLI